MKKTLWVFLLQKYGKFWSISLDDSVERKPLISEEWYYSLHIQIFLKREGVNCKYSLLWTLHGIMYDYNEHIWISARKFKVQAFKKHFFHCQWQNFKMTLTFVRVPQWARPKNKTREIKFKLINFTEILFNIFHKN